LERNAWLKVLALSDDLAYRYQVRYVEVFFRKSEWSRAAAPHVACKTYGAYLRQDDDLHAEQAHGHKREDD